MVVWPKIVNRIILEGEKVQVSCLLEVLGSRTGIPKGLKKKNGKFRRGRGVNDFGIRRAWGGRAFWNFRGQGGIKILMPPVVGYGYFLESLI